MNAHTALSAGIVAVPILLKEAGKAMGEAEKKRKQEQKRLIARQREAAYKAYFSNQKATYDDQMRLWCKSGRASGDCAMRVQFGIIPATGYNPSVYGGSCVRYSADKVDRKPQTIGVVADPFIAPLEYHPRRKVSSGETPEQFHDRLVGEMQERWSMGMSYVTGACNCGPCVTVRSRFYNYINTQGNRPEVYAKRMIAQWDTEHNPFCKGYVYRGRRESRGNNADENGNPRARGASMRQRLSPVPTGRPTAARTSGAGSRGVKFTDVYAKGGATRLVGLEVEHNRRISQTEAWTTKWNGAQVISDGSCGYEAVTPPIAGKHIPECIRDLCKALNENKAGCDSRCGLHCHVDARDMFWPEMLRFLAVFCRVESILFLIGGQNRYGVGSYCHPAGALYAKALQEADPKGAVLSAACLSDGERLRPAAEGRQTLARSPVSKKGGGRYKSINIMPWIAGRAYNRPDTTVEFRLHRGTHNPERIIQWAAICQDLVDWSIKATNADVAKLPKSAARALCVISPRCKSWIIKRLLGWRAATTAGTAEVEDDVGNVKPRRIVSVQGGLYLVDKTRISRRDRDDDD